ncbi:MAG: TIGR02221 family CRISPR-associated protein [Bacteroidaceae bacterium]|nr:TIGR02221 family CRISPR-associated protein [Bacteroidaceae bacterium]
MSRKVFISFLGTNNYVQCSYDFDGVVSAPVRFVQEALIEQICKDWTEDDRILVFCTSMETTGEEGSKEINWFDNGQSRISDEIERIGLQHRLQDLQTRIGLKAQIEEFDIEAGFSEGEIWNIFNTVYAQLQPDDQIYFDVTHAFRSIPLFSIVLFNYSKFMKGTRLMTILYGAFEKLGPAYKVKELPLEQRIVPVVDLTDIARLQEYNQVASNLKEFGKVTSLKDAIIAEQVPTSDQAIRDLGKSISQLDEYIATIDLKEIKSGKFISSFRSYYKIVRKRQNIAVPIRNILDELYKETEGFASQNDYRNIEEAINWTIKHDMLMQAYPLAAEYIILRVSDMFGELKPPRMSSKQFRVFVSSILGMTYDDLLGRNWKNELAEYPEVADELADNPLVREIRPLYEPIRQSRNSLAHGNGAIKYKELKKGIPKILKCIKYLNAEYLQYASTAYILKDCYGKE